VALKFSNEAATPKVSNEAAALKFSKELWR
jgi:hypothetical protein